MAARDPVALLPLAAVEQHGPHLPLATDVTIGEGIVRTATDELARRDDEGDLLLMPALAIGASLEHIHFPGTLSLPAELLGAEIRAVGAGVARAGIRRLILFNSHGGNKAVIDTAALRLRADHGLLVAKINYFRFAVPPDTLSAEELTQGLHGGALETSMMLHLAPEAVRRETLNNYESIGSVRARAGLGLTPEGEAGFAWLAEDLHPDGVAGNAAAADAETGTRLVNGFGRRLADIVVEAATFDLASLGGMPKN